MGKVYNLYLYGQKVTMNSEQIFALAWGLSAPWFIDKFHLIQMANKAMDEVRKAERKGNDMI